jgi:4-amino-4-deoxy-L-arabinose transferase-like glycosyltransferase
MVVLAFTLRVGAIVILHTYKFRVTEQNFGFGWEMGRIGAALATGQGFSNPFHDPTGPTAWEPPLYPFLIAAVFKTFGTYSRASALVLLSINSLFSALTCVPIFLIGKRCFGEKVAVWSAWTWALLPYIMYWCTRWVWETSLSALLGSVIFWLALTLEERDRLASWAGFGLLWGISALNSPVLLSFLPVSGLYAWYRRRKRGKSSLGGVAVAALVFLACIAPWLVRNQKTFGKFVFLRSNFGAELRLGNGPWANGTWMWFLHPTQNLVEFRRYQQMGEIAYVQARKQEAIAWIKEDPVRFVGASVKRLIYYWAGVPRSSEIPALAQFKNSLFLASSVLTFWGLGRALRQRKPGAWLFFWLILLYPAVYYLVFPHARYRHPIEPEMMMVGVFLISEAENKPRKSTEPEKPWRSEAGPE